MFAFITFVVVALATIVALGCRVLDPFQAHVRTAYIGGTAVLIVLLGIPTFIGAVVWKLFV